MQIDRILIVIPPQMKITTRHKIIMHHPTTDHQPEERLHPMTLPPTTDPTIILLPRRESTDHIFCNKDLITDIENVTNGEHLRLHTSAGSIDTYQKGRFGDFNVWYNPKSSANILSLALVTEQF
mmetsp:Transcript_703/g.1110  ORF Transcript_703/g.1110 Transcript_703/m.1110 type:complete len:124 (+) Transcript_703:518-889(+)